jgi:hypothetical protein
MSKKMFSLALLLIPWIARADDNAALLAAAQDLRQVPQLEKLTTRYVWVTSNDLEDMRAVSLCLNYLSRSNLIARPLPIVLFDKDALVGPKLKADGPKANGKEKIAQPVPNMVLLRVNLRELAPKAAELSEIIKAWEELRFEPRFNLLLTRDTLKFAAGIDLPKLSEMKREERKQEAKVKTSRPNLGGAAKPEAQDKFEFVTEGDVAEGEVLRVVSEHLDKALVAELVEGTQSQAPVVTHRYLIGRALSTIQDKGVWKAVWGGLYYDLAGVGKSKDAKRSDEDLFFERLGIGGGGKTLVQLFEELESDQRAATFRSGVTDNARLVEAYPTLVSKPTDLPMVMRTRDRKQGSVDVASHPLMNLVDFKDDAREVIAVKSNGLHLFALFNGKGERQDQVPDDLASDFTVPAPHNARLQSAIGCIRCHGREGGWRRVANDVRKLYGGQFARFGDQAVKDQDAVRARLKGLYDGDFEDGLLPAARDAYARAILRATGPWKAGKGDQTDIVKVSSEHLAAVWAYRHNSVTPQDALTELGHKSDEADAVRLLNKLLPPVGVAVNGAVPEDPRIAALKAGIPINRTDMDLAYSFMATRIAKGKAKAAEKDGGE